MEFQFILRTIRDLEHLSHRTDIFLQQKKTTKQSNKILEEIRINLDIQSAITQIQAMIGMPALKMRARRKPIRGFIDRNYRSVNYELHIVFFFDFFCPIFNPYAHDTIEHIAR